MSEFLLAVYVYELWVCVCMKVTGEGVGRRKWCRGMGSGGPEGYWMHILQVFCPCMSSINFVKCFVFWKVVSTCPLLFVLHPLEWGMTYAIARLCFCAPPNSVGGALCFWSGLFVCFCFFFLCFSVCPLKRKSFISSELNVGMSWKSVCRWISLRGIDP